MKAPRWLIALVLVPFTSGAQPPNEPAQTSPEAAQMQTHMEEMRTLMARIRDEADPAERQRLMSEHMHVMHDGITMMGRMMGGGMMGGPGAAGARGSQCAQADTDCRMREMQNAQRMMGERMGMMQMMMGQMMEHMMAQRSGTQEGGEPADREKQGAEGEAQPQGREHEAHH